MIDAIYQVLIEGFALRGLTSKSKGSFFQFKPLDDNLVWKRVLRVASVFHRPKMAPPLSSASENSG